MTSGESIGPMQFRAEEYYRASLERIRQAREVLREGSSYALAMYCAGLAVECLLRAFRWVEDTSFEGRHDINELLKASGIVRVNEDFMRRKGYDEEDIDGKTREVRAKVQEVAILWHNNLRFASEARLRAHLKQIGRARGIKGDPLKKNASDLVESAQTIIDRGTTLWISERKSRRP